MGNKSFHPVWFFSVRLYHSTFSFASLNSFAKENRTRAFHFWVLSRMDIIRNKLQTETDKCFVGEMISSVPGNKSPSDYGRMDDELELKTIQGVRNNNNVAGDVCIQVIPGNGACSDRGNSVGLEVSPLLTSSQVGGSVAEDEVDATVTDETNLQRVKRELNEVMVWKLKVWMVILIVLLLIALIFTVTFIVCAAGSDDVDEKYDRSSFVVERFFKGNFTLANNSITLHPATQPDDSEKLLEILKQQLTAVYNSSPALARYFSDVTINNFRDDTAQFELQFIIPSENEQLVRYTLSRDMVKSVLLQHFYDQDQDAGDYPYVIPASLNMEVWTKRRI